MNEEGSARAAEVMAAEDAVAATLRMIPQLMRVLSDSAATAAAAAGSTEAAAAALGSGPLARALLVEAPGGGAPLAAAVASYAAYPYAAACCPLALPALAALCEAAPADPPLACAIPALAPSSVSAFATRALAWDGSGSDATEDPSTTLDVRAAIVRALTPAAGRVAPDTAHAAAAFITAAATKQPMLAEAMLLPAKLAGGDEESALDALWELSLIHI